MGIPTNVRHIIYVSVFAACAALQALGKVEPTWLWISMAVQLCMILLTVFTDSPGTAARMAALRGGARIAAVCLWMGMAVSVMRCSWLQSPQGAATVQAGVDLAICVLNHSQEPIAQIVTDCGAGTAEDVIKILDAHTAAMARAKDGGL